MNEQISEAFTSIMPMAEDEGLEGLINYVRQHEQIKSNMDMLTERKTFVRGQIDRMTEELGKEDAKGHIVVELNDTVSGVSKVTRQRRVSKNFNEEEAHAILKEKDLIERCVKTVAVLDEEAVMAAYNEGLLTDEDIDKMFPEKVTWATVIK